MSEEEKKAIERFKANANYCITSKETTKIILNLIEKHSKEIEEAEQKEKKAYIDGTNVAHELCNKMWKNKIKAKIEEYEEILKSPIIKDDYKREVEHIIRVLKELGGKNE